jgi:hypothetical protein
VETDNKFFILRIAQKRNKENYENETRTSRSGLNNTCGCSQLKLQSNKDLIVWQKMLVRSELVKFISSSIVV